MIKVILENESHVDSILRVSSTPYYYHISDGTVPNHYTYRVTGYNNAVGTTLEDIAETSAATINLPTTAVAMEVISSSAEDSSAGTGTQVVEINGLDNNFNEITESVTMNGVGAVAFTKLFRRINNFHSMMAGSTGASVGNITLRGSGGGVTYSQITATQNMSMQCIYTVPANYAGFVVGWSAGATTKDSKIILRATADWHNRKLTSIFLHQDVMVSSGNTTYKTFDIPVRIPAKSDIKVSALALVAGAQVAASIELFIEDEE